MHLFFLIQISNLILTIVQCILKVLLTDTCFQIIDITFYGKKFKKKNNIDFIDYVISLILKDF